MTEINTKDIAKPVKQTSIPRCGMGYYYYDYFCPECTNFLVFEPVGLRMIEEGIETRCPHCGQKISWKKAERTAGIDAF